MRAIWKGWLSFGLINIPINLYTGVNQKALRFHFLHAKDKSPIRFARICKKDGKEIPWEEITRGYELESGDMVVLTEEDLAKAYPEKTKTIEILDFVDEEEVDPIYYEKPYFLEPQRGAAKAYLLLREALKKTKKVGIAKFILRNRENLAALRPHDNLILLHQLRYSSEIRQSGNLQIPKGEKTSLREIDLAIKLIDQLTHSFDPKHYKDTYQEDILDIIKKKAKGKRVVPQEKPKKKRVQHDLMKVLKASLQKKRKRLAA